MSEESIRTAPDLPDWVQAVCADEPLPAQLEVSVDGRDETDSPPADVDAGAKRVRWWLCGAAVAAAASMIATFVVFGGGPKQVAPATHRTIYATPVVSAAATTGRPAAADAAVPFTAATASCGPGSTSPQALTDTSTDSAWVCVRGPQESRVDGQVLHVSFTCGPARPQCSYLLASVSVTPGWLAKTVAGKDQWLAHRVVTRLQFNFFNGAALAADPFFVDTGSVHGPVTATLPGPALASRADVLILHTDRPPAAPPLTDVPSPTQTSEDPATVADPVDATFAMSQLQFVGHAPD